MPFEPDDSGQWWYVARNYRTRAYRRSCLACEGTFFSRVCDETRFCSKSCAQSGSFSRNWKGGRHTDLQGYVHVLVPENEPVVGQMRDRRGYVTEHRLVMARALGRPLHGRETVHHLNGDRGDNRLKNLQLLHKPHGPGAGFECGDCGSRNVKAVERQ